MINRPINLSIWKIRNKQYLPPFSLLFLNFRAPTIKCSAKRSLYMPLPPLYSSSSPSLDVKTSIIHFHTLAHSEPTFYIFHVISTPTFPFISPYFPIFITHHYDVSLFYLLYIHSSVGSSFFFMLSLLYPNTYFRPFILILF